MVELDRENFTTEVLDSAGVVLVDFWGPKCAPCVALMPHIEKLADRYAGRAKFTKVNASKSPRLSIEQQVSGLPTILIYRAGAQVAAFRGDEARLDAIATRLDELLSDTAAN